MNDGVTMNWDYQILVRNENEFLWSLADNVILIVYPIKFIFSCLFYSGSIGSVTNRFGFNSDLGLHRINKSSGQFGFDSGHIRFRVNSDHYSFGSVRISGRNRFNSFSCWFESRFESFDLGHSCQVYYRSQALSLLEFVPNSFAGFGNN